MNIRRLHRADIGLVAAGAIVFGVQALVPAYEDSYKVWYPELRKPSWNPPNWVFPAVWIPLKLLQSVRSRIGQGSVLTSHLTSPALMYSFACLQAALWLVWKSAGDSKADVVLPIVLFSAHALLGNQWNGTGDHGL